MFSEKVVNLIPNKAFARLASDKQLDSVVKALELNGMHAVIVNSGAEAKQLVLSLVPEGAEVYANQSQTLENLGLTAEFDQSGRYDAVRPKVMLLDRKTQSDQIRELRSTPDIIIGSVHAITEDGKVLVSSFGGSQLGAYAYGSAKVIWVVGSQKIVNNLDEGFRRIDEYSYPLEDARLQSAYGMHTTNGKVLLINKEVVQNRVTVILVKEELGY